MKYTTEHAENIARNSNIVIIVEGSALDRIHCDNITIGKRFDPFTNSLPDITSLLSTETCSNPTTENLRLKTIIKEALNSLDPLQQNIIKQYFYIGNTFKQIAINLQIPIHTTRIQKNKAMKLLRIYLLRYYYFKTDAEIFSDCVICCHKELIRINAFIDMYYDYYDNQAPALTKKLRRIFKISTLTPSLTLQHVKEHLNNHKQKE
jgi:hypothetical protein